MKKEDKIKVLCVKPEQEPEVVELENTIVAMQEMVGGRIEEYMPWEEEVAIICNEEGKMFLVVGIKGDGFCSLSDDMLRKYEKMYHDPEVFYKTKDGVMMVKGERKTQDAL